jgi:hypothetical protein
MEQGLVEIHAAYNRFPGKDSSVGDDSCIYGIEQSNIVPIVEALCPPGLDPTECSKFVEQSLYVTALPGMYSAENYDSILSGKELPALLLQQLDSKKKEMLGHDRLWQTKLAHSLGYIKTADEQKKVAKNVWKAWDSA